MPLQGACRESARRNSTKDYMSYAARGLTGASLQSRRFRTAKTTNMKSITIKFLTLSLAAVLSGCAGGPAAQTGTATGAVVGGTAGYFIGRANGNSAAGAVIGAVAGGAAGNAIGNNVDQNRRAQYDAYNRPYYP